MFCRSTNIDGQIQTPLAMVSSHTHMHYSVRTQTTFRSLCIKSKTTVYIISLAVEGGYAYDSIWEISVPAWLLIYFVTDSHSKHEKLSTPWEVSCSTFISWSSLSKWVNPSFVNCTPCRSPQLLLLLHTCMCACSLGLCHIWIC